MFGTPGTPKSSMYHHISLLVGGSNPSETYEGKIDFHHPSGEKKSHVPNHQPVENRLV